MKQASDNRPALTITIALILVIVILLYSTTMRYRLMNIEKECNEFWINKTCTEMLVLQQAYLRDKEAGNAYEQWKNISLTPQEANSS